VCAFSNRVSKDYWGDVLLKSYKDAELFIKFVRQIDGTPETLVDLEKLAKKVQIARSKRCRAAKMTAYLKLPLM
jgi:hypothetical protein